MEEGNTESSQTESSQDDGPGVIEDIPAENIEQIGDAVAAFIEGREGYIPVLTEIDIRRMDGKDAQDLVAEFVTDFPMTSEFVVFCAFVEDHDRSAINELLNEATDMSTLTKSHVSTFWNLWPRFNWISEATIAFARSPGPATITGLSHNYEGVDDDGDIIVNEQGIFGIDELYDVNMTIHRLAGRVANSVDTIDQLLQNTPDDESLNEENLEMILNILNDIESMSEDIREEIEFRLKSPDIDSDEINLEDQFDT